MHEIEEVGEVKILGMADALKRFSVPVIKEKSKIEYSFQDLGKQMEIWFPKKEQRLMWSLFYKYSEGQIRDAYSAIKKTNVHSVPYLIGILKRN